MAAGFHRAVRAPRSLATDPGQSPGAGADPYALRRQGMTAATVGLKLRYADFTTLTRQMRLSVPTDDERVIYRTARTLLRRAWQRGRPVRLLGVAGRRLCPPVGQLPLL